MVQFVVSFLLGTLARKPYHMKRVGNLSLPTLGMLSVFLISPVHGSVIETYFADVDSHDFSSA